MRKSNLFYQGEDILFNMSIQNESGSSIDLDALADFVIYFYCSENEPYKIKMAKVAKAGYITMKRISSTVYRGIIDSSITKLLKCGTYVAEINIKTTNSELDDQELNRIGANEAFFLEHAAIRVESNKIAA